MCESVVESDICSICNRRTATLDWANDPTAAIYGWTTRVCEICSVEEQLSYARKQADRVPELEYRLTTLLKRENKNEI